MYLFLLIIKFDESLLHNKNAKMFFMFANLTGYPEMYLFRKKGEIKTWITRDEGVCMYQCRLSYKKFNFWVTSHLKSGGGEGVYALNVAQDGIFRTLLNSLRLIWHI